MRLKSISMDVTIILENVELNCEGDYTPEEPMVRYYPDGSGHPGAASGFELTKVEINGVDVTDLLSKEWTRIEELCITKIEE
jgi:hypothetical protein